MPIYEYSCKNCGLKTEALQGRDEALLTKCPDCNLHSLEKLISPAGFRLKGSGWYETDFKSSGRKRIAEGDQPPSDTSQSKSSEKAGAPPPPKDSQAKTTAPSKNADQH